MGFLDKRSDTEKELESYYKKREKQNTVNNQNTNNINNNSEKPKNKNTLSLVALIVFIVLFFAIIILSSINTGACLIPTGLMFAIMPMIIFFNDGAKSPKFPFILVSLIGVCITAGGIAMLIGDNATEIFESFMSSILPFVFVGGFLLGVLYLILRVLYLMLKTIISTNKQKQRCKYKIKATVVDMLTKRGDKGKTLYSPVYKYSYLGKEYTVHEDIYRNSISLKIGDNTDIFINENKPDEFYIKHPEDTIMFIVIGAMFIVIAICIFYNIFFAPAN